MALITIYSDYVCPFCYLADQILQEVRRELPQLNIEVDWKPFELRPYPTPTLRSEDDYLPRIWEQAVYPMARQLGVDIQLPTISPQPHTHLAFEGFQYAREKGKGEAYTLRMFEAFFKEDRDIGDIGVLTQLAAELGLDATEFGQALDQRSYQEAHRRELQEVYRLGIQAVPSFKIGENYYQGVLPKEQLKKIIRASVTA
jgi:predicted DsbA family dithiol-disulfide isomerase